MRRNFFSSRYSYDFEWNEKKSLETPRSIAQGEPTKTRGNPASGKNYEIVCFCRRRVLKIFSHDKATFSASDKIGIMRLECSSRDEFMLFV